jgi:hypothetical protein
MPIRAVLGSLVVATLLVDLSTDAAPATAAPPEATLSSLFFSEGWKQPPASGERPATQAAVSSPNLLLSLYGVGAKKYPTFGSRLNASSILEPVGGWCNYGDTGLTRMNSLLRMCAGLRSTSIRYTDAKTGYLM